MGTGSVHSTEFRELVSMKELELLVPRNLVPKLETTGLRVPVLKASEYQLQVQRTWQTGSLTKPKARVSTERYVLAYQLGVSSA